MRCRIAKLDLDLFRSRGAAVTPTRDRTIEDIKHKTRLDDNAASLVKTITTMHVALGALCLLVAYQTTHSYFIGNGEAFESAALKYAGFALLNRSGVSVVSSSTSITAVFHDDYRVLDLLLMLVPDFGQTPAKTSESPLNFRVRNFEVDIDSGDWSIGTKEFPTWTIEKNVLAVSNVTASIRIHVDPSATEKVSIRGFDIAGTVRIGGTGIDLKFSQIGPNLYFLGAPTSGSIPVGSFVEWLGSKILPDALEEPLRKIGLERFTIEKARVVGTYGPSGFAFGISGTPTIAQWGGFRCHFIATRYAALSYQRARTVYTFAIDLPRFELAGLVRTLTGGSVDFARRSRARKPYSTRNGRGRIFGQCCAELTASPSRRKRTKRDLELYSQRR